MSLERRAGAPARLLAPAAGAASNGPVIVGTIPFDVEANIGSFREVLRRGAFAEVLRDDCVFTVGHEHGGMLILARVTAGTLSLRESAKGLEWVASLPRTAIGEHFAEAVRRRDLGVSFAFIVGEDRWSDGRRLREILRVARLKDVSLVGFPAYQDATATVLEGGIRTRDPVSIVQARASLKNRQRRAELAARNVR